MEQKANLVSMFPILAMLVLFYFLLIRPQQKKAQQQKEMINNLLVGDELVLTSGIICVVEQIPAEKDFIFVKLNDNNIVRVFKDAIAGKYNPNEVVAKKNK